MKTIEQLAKRGEQHDVMDALRLLTNAYIEMWGSSISYRTVVFCAAEKWQEKLAWLDLPLSETARKCGLIDFVPYINKNFAMWGCDRYDIAGMTKDERLDCCKQIVKEKAFDEKTLEVLCWGFLESLTSKDISQNLEAKSGDGTLLKGSLLTSVCGETYIEMTAPLKVCIHAIKHELIRNANELLVEVYNDCQKLYGMEKEARRLYQEYQAELEKVKNEKDYKKKEVFRKVYRAIVSETIILPSSIEDLFKEWWGLEFYKWE